MLSNIGTTEITILCFILVALFGGKRIPEFVRSLGISVTEFRKAVRED
jgi:sec-independent protein translocase protein TatA